MNFSEEYLYDKFKENYDEALTAKSRGNFALAKEKFYRAADFMEKLAFVSQADIRAERGVRASRIRVIADSIKPEAKNIGGAVSADAPENKKISFPYAESTEIPDAKDMERYFTFYRAEDLREGFDGIIGLDAAKEAVTEYVVNPIRYADAYSYNFIDSKALLLEGPPGTGKTTFAKAVAREVRQPFALVNVASLVNCYVGETGKNIDRVFACLRDYAAKNQCGITVFFDELDEIAKSRGGDDKASASAVPALLRNLDGVRQNKSFLILANTNCKDMLDAAILDRFRKQIYIPLPDKDMRLNLFKSKIAEVEEEFKKQLDFEELSVFSEGLSGRDITFICDDFKYFLSEIKAKLTSGYNLQGKFLQLVTERKNSKQKK